jgi:Histidyl-tRNA synthetase
MQALPGFRDFLPDDCAVRNYIFARWREVARRYSFIEWDGPVLESTELYKKKSGAEIVDQLFNFTDKGEREVAMRPELTPSLARVVAAREREFKKPLKWFSIGQFFRYEKQQRGRLREHFQLNCDIIGEANLPLTSSWWRSASTSCARLALPRTISSCESATVISGLISCAKEMYQPTDGTNCCRQSINPDVNRARKQRRNLANSPTQSFQF